MEERKKKRGDRRDGYLVEESDPMHMIMPYILGERADNEAFFNDLFDMTAVDRYMEEKNKTAQYKWTYFHVINAAIAKTIYLRPKMNRFILNRRYYDRKKITLTFTAKNKFSDHADESMVILEAEDNDTPIGEQLHDKLCAEVYKIKKEHVSDGTTDVMSKLCKIPRPILSAVCKLLFWLDKHDWLPQIILDVDPYRNTVFLSNLGSINMEAEYHHLVNWSTNSIFVLVNKAKWMPVVQLDGSIEVKKMMKIGVTIDERIADGFYFMKSMYIFRYLMDHPEELDKPISSPLPLDQIFQK